MRSVSLLLILAVIIPTAVTGIAVHYAIAQPRPLAPTSPPTTTAAPMEAAAQQAATARPTEQPPSETAEQLVERLLSLPGYVEDPRVRAEDQLTPLLREIAARSEDG